MLLMKNFTSFLKLALLATVLLATGLRMSAYDFYTGGIYYGIGSTGVTVENKGSFNTYSGNVTIPEKVTYGGTTYNVIGIGYQAFKNCTGLTNVTMPNSIWLILNEAFSGCTSLTTIVLPSSITSIYNNAFVGCSGLRSIYVRRKTPASANTNNFDASTYSTATLFVPEESYDAYMSTAPWSSFTNVKKTNYDFEKNGIYYKITDANARTVKVTYRDTNYDNYSGSVNIPSSVSYDGVNYSVTAIGGYAFRGTNDGGHLTSVIIPNSVKTIEHDAFWLQKNLGNVSIPSSVTTIESYAFCWCSNMTSVNIPNSVTSLGAHAYSQCKKLSSLTIGNSLTKIQDVCFYGCEKLTSVTIPDNITSIGSNAFEACTILSSVTLGSGLTSMSSSVFSGCNALQNVTCKALTPPSIASNTFTSAQYSSAKLTVPYSSMSAYQAASYWKNFTTINKLNYDFVVSGIYYRKTSSNKVEVTYKDGNFNSYSGGIIIPRTVTFNGTTYTVTAIGQQAFRGCTNLSDVTLSANIETIESLAFLDCSKLNYVFSMPSGLKRIGSYAFSGCSQLKSINIPNRVETIETYAFKGCLALTSVAIPSSATTLGNYVFENCTGLKTITFGAGLTVIPVGMFKGCTGLTSMVLPDNIQSIENYAFENCTSLAEITLGGGMLSVPGTPFKGCTALRTVTCLSANPPHMTTSECFPTATYSNGTLKVPGASLNTYKSADWWRMFNTVEAMSFDFYVNGIYYKKTSNNTVKVTYKELLYESYTGSVTIPSSIKVGSVTYKVTAIGDYAFYMCKNLTSVSMPNTIITIEACAFEKCSGLTNVTIPNSVTTLGVDAFSSCTGLKSIDIPNSVTKIDMLAFYNCTAMTSATIGSGVTNIYNQAFANCSALTSVTCLSTTPPTMSANNVFSTSTYNTATLNVPKNSLNAYKSADWWRLFNTIVGGDFGGDPLDVNDDGEVNIADVNTLLDAVLSGSTNTKYDVNGDNEVGISDMNTIIDAILN